MPRLVTSLGVIYSLTFCSNNVNKGTWGAEATASCGVNRGFFNHEVERRVKDQLFNFLAVPEEINGFVANLRGKGGFPSGSLAPIDREMYFKLITSVQSNLVYSARDDGFGMGYDNGFHFAAYREPGNSGYSVDDPEYKKQLMSCVDPASGEPTACLLEAGRTYIKYYECPEDDEDCDLYEPCPDEDSQTLDCETAAALESANITQDECLERKKWCRKYTIETAKAVSENSTYTGLGYFPYSYTCLNEKSEVTQTPGDALSVDGSGTPGSTCVYEDGVTAVQRELVGDYAYCGGNGAICNDTFTGAFYSPEYDGRYRPWYLSAKERQRPHWSDPYLYETGYIGMTHMHPVYNPSERGQVFAGVLAIDYKFEDFARFLEANYKHSNTMVAIVEDAEPHYLIGMSTGTLASVQYLASDPTQPCPTTVQYGSKDCISERRQITKVGDRSAEDTAIQHAFLQQRKAGYPEELLFVKISDEVGADNFVCQSTLFEPNEGDSNLKWRIITVSPASEETNDTIVPGDPFFGVLMFTGFVGFGVCFTFFAYLYRKRNVRAIAYGDWRFTCAFVVGCGLLNTATFTLLGENTESSCLLRMWFFHTFFVLALAPLFIKCWRMYMLTRATYQRTTITNTQAALYTLPFILVQTMILLVFTFVDPPKPTEIFLKDNGFTRRIICETDTPALFIVQVVFEAGLVLVGCALAYLQRNMDEKFGESKQMLVAMYNIALVGIVVLVVINTANMYGSAEKMLLSIGILWGSVISAAAFVLPRIIQIHRGIGLRRHKVNISGAFSTEFSGDITNIQRKSEPKVSQVSSLGTISENESKKNLSLAIERSVEFAAGTNQP